MNFDALKAAANIKARANAVNGDWTMKCEVLGCKETTESGKSHQWDKTTWIICPTHSKKN